MKVLVSVYSGILLTALLLGSSGCAVITVFSENYNEYSFQKRRFPYRVEQIERAYLSPENEIIICFRGWPPAALDRITPKTRGEYTIRIPAETFATRSLAHNRRRRPENNLWLPADTFTKGWITEQVATSENLREIPVVNAWDVERQTTSMVAQEYGNPPRVWKGSEATVYDIGKVPAPLLPHELQFLYVQRTPDIPAESFSLGPIPELTPLQQEGTDFAILRHEEYVALHPTAKATYPVVAPVVFVVDIVSLPVKAGAIAFAYAYIILNPDALQLF